MACQGWITFFDAHVPSTGCPPKRLPSQIQIGALIQTTYCIVEAFLHLPYV